MVIREMKGLLLWAGIAAGQLICANAFAQTCTTSQYPFPLQNGGIADANQVTADLNCAPIAGLANWKGNVGIGTTTPQQKLWVQDGDIWISGNQKLAFSTDESLDPTPNVAFGATGNNAYVANWSGAAYTVNMTVQGSNGFVGIGTTTPAQKLWVQDGDIWISGNQKLAFSTDESLDATPNVAFGATGNDAYIANWNGGSYNTNLTVKGGNGFVGIGTSTPSATLHVNGSTILTQGYSTTSDARLKRDITPIDDALKTVEELKGVRYRWRPVTERSVGKDLVLPISEPQVGFLAQDLEKVIPEAVVVPKAGSADVYTVKDEKIIPFLVEAIKEQQVEIALLRKEVEELKDKEK